MGRPNICNKHSKAPAIGINGTQGVLNGRSRSGFDFLKTIIPAQTITNANNVPIETNSPNILMGNIPAKKLQQHRL